MADAWQPAAAPPFVAGRGTRAARLDRGRILAIGSDGCGSASVAAAVFNAVTNEWMVTEAAGTDAMVAEAAARTLHDGAAAARLHDTTFLVSGGTDTSGSIVVAADVVDASTGAATTAGVLTVGRSGHTATRLRNGTVLVAGGKTFAGNTATAEIYLPGIAYESRPLAAPRVHGVSHAAAFDSKDHVFVLHPGQKPPQGRVAYAPSDVPLPGMGRPVNELGTGVKNGTPHSVRVDATDHIWVAVNSGAPNAVVEYDAHGAIALRLEQTESQPLLACPMDVARDGAGSIFVLDGCERGRVLKFTARGRFVKASGTAATPCSGRTRSPPTPPAMSTSRTAATRASRCSTTTSRSRQVTTPSATRGRTASARGRINTCSTRPTPDKPSSPRPASARF